MNLGERVLHKGGQGEEKREKRIKKKPAEKDKSLTDELKTVHKARVGGLRGRFLV